jgi:nitrate reductase alpha subunit
MKREPNGVTWLKDETAPGRRRWEEFYRNRWQTTASSAARTA